MKKLHLVLKKGMLNLSSVTFLLIRVANSGEHFGLSWLEIEKNSEEDIADDRVEMAKVE